MKVDLDVPITVPPIKLFKLGKEGREDVTSTAYRGFNGADQMRIKFRVGDGDYVVVDDSKQERKISVANGRVIGGVPEAPKPMAKPQAEMPVEEEAEAPKAWTRKGRKTEEL